MQCQDDKPQKWTADGKLQDQGMLHHMKGQINNQWVNHKHVAASDRRGAAV